MLYNPRLTKDKVNYIKILSSVDFYGILSQDFCWCCFFTVANLFCRIHSRASWQVSALAAIYFLVQVVFKKNLQLFFVSIFYLFTDLNLAYPKMIDVAVPANMVCGLQDVTKL